MKAISGKAILVLCVVLAVIGLALLINSCPGNCAGSNHNVNTLTDMYCPKILMSPVWPILLFLVGCAGLTLTLVCNALQKKKEN